MLACSVKVFSMRAVFFSLVLLLPALFGLHVSPAVAADESDRVKAFADQLASRAMIVVKNEGLSPQAKQHELETLFDSHVDINWVARFVLGKYWKTATLEQQTSYMTNYKAFILKNYTSKLAEYTGQKYVIKSARPDDEPGDYLLTMELLNTNDPNVVINYRIRKEGNDFKIFDIVVEGVSMITTQRSEFGSVVANKGLSFLIDALAKKAQAATL